MIIDDAGTDSAVPTGEFIRAWLDEKQMSQGRLAARLGVSAKHVSLLIHGVATLSHDLALRLERVTGIEALYQEDPARPKNLSDSSASPTTRRGRRFGLPPKPLTGRAAHLEAPARHWRPGCGLGELKAEAVRPGPYDSERLHQFWFTLFRELGHILLHSKSQVLIDGDGQTDSGPAEAQADAFARDLVIPPETLGLMPRGRNRAAVRRFADQIGVSPGIVVGRVQREPAISDGATN